MKKETIMVFLSEQLNEQLNLNGVEREIVPYDGNIHDFFSDDANQFLAFVDRRIAESSNFKDRPYTRLFRQPITYFTISRLDRKVAVYQKIKGTGEKALLGKMSVGFGGHMDLIDVNPDDVDFFVGYISAQLRELDEEVDLTGIEYHSRAAIKGLVVDNTNEVGKDHIGFYSTIQLKSDPETLVLKEPAMQFVGWMSYEEVLEQKDQFENWSVLVAEYELNH